MYSINDVDNDNDSGDDDNDVAEAEDEGDDENEVAEDKGDNDDNEDDDVEDFSEIFEGMRSDLLGLAGYPVFFIQYPAGYPVY